MFIVSFLYSPDEEYVTHVTVSADLFTNLRYISNDRIETMLIYESTQNSTVQWIQCRDDNFLLSVEFLFQLLICFF